MQEIQKRKNEIFLGEKLKDREQAVSSGISEEKEYGLRIEENLKNRFSSNSY